MSDGFKGDGGKGGKREIFDAGDGRFPFSNTFCIKRGSGKERFSQIEGANADGGRSWGSE